MGTIGTKKNLTKSNLELVSAVNKPESRLTPENKPEM